MLSYDRERVAAAVKLNVRTSILDKLVQAKRADVSDDFPQQGQALELFSPEHWPEPVNGDSLLTAITEQIRKYLVTESGAAEAVALWVAHAHMLDAFTVSPKLAITSPEKQCGKTSLLDVIGHLVPRPLLVSNTTTAAVFRAIEAAHPTLLIDEADTFLTHSDDLRGILNSGHRRAAAYVVRVAGDDYQPRKFSTWAATAIAMIGRLPSTLEDRSISIQLRRRRPNEAIARFRDSHCPELDCLARMAARWAADCYAAVQAADPDLPESLHNRAADNWRPLIAIADHAGGEWPTHARQIAVAAGTAAQASPSDGALLLEDIRSIFEAKKCDRISSFDLTFALIELEGHPWAEWQNMKPLSRHGLARLLAPYGIRPQTIRTGTQTAKGYCRDQFNEAFNRYLSNGPRPTVTPSQP